MGWEPAGDASPVRSGPARWVLLADARGRGEARAARLRQRGQGVALLTCEASELASALDTAFAPGAPEALRVVYLRALDAVLPEDADTAALPPALALGRLPVGARPKELARRQEKDA